MGIETLKQARDAEENQLRELHPEYALLKIDYQKGICLLGDVPLEVDKFYDVITHDTSEQGDSYSVDSWMRVYVTRDEGKITPHFIERDSFSGLIKKISLRGDLHSKRFLMKLISGIDKSKKEDIRLDFQLGWGSFEGLRV